MDWEISFVQPCVLVGLRKFLPHSNRQLAENRHVMCVVEKARFEPRTLGTRTERAINCATTPVGWLAYIKNTYQDGDAALGPSVGQGTLVLDNE